MQEAYTNSATKNRLIDHQTVAKSAKQCTRARILSKITAKIDNKSLNILLNENRIVV